MAQTTDEFEKVAPATDPADEVVPLEEEALLARALDRLAQKVGVVAHDSRRYDADLVALRDEIGEARLEDVPALIAQMERLQGVAARRAEAEGALVDPKSPYFGHLRLREQREQSPGWTERDVMIGRATFVDAKAGVRIVDWRHAPVSQLYYRYSEGSPYEERFGDREVEGEILARRTVTIDQSTLVRVSAPQGTFVRSKGGKWRRFDARESSLAGGQGTAARPGRPVKGVLGVGPGGQQRLDRHLPEIAALIDPRQFELITAPDAGLVVIQGGAGSGKTTIGLHRMAYLAYTNPNRFAPQKMRVVTYGAALAAYISQVLPALGVHGVQVITFPTWAEKELRHAIPWLAVATEDDAPSVVTRMKKHPAILHELERRAEAHTGRRNSRAVVELWADALTDLDRLVEILGTGPQAMRSDEIKRAHRHCADRCSAVLESDQGFAESDPDEEPPDDADVRGATGIDGVRTEDERARLDPEDHPLLLRANQLLRGPLRGSKRSTLINHLFVDEAQDLSPLELAVLIAQTSPERSITLAGDTSQRLFLDNGFSDWRGVLEHLSLSHVAIEPLRIAYRSTQEILEVARFAMGPLADPDPPLVPRSGAPVEAHLFPGSGAAVAFLAEALRPLAAREPLATVAVLARYPEQADLYYDGLKRSEVPYLRRVRAQDFSFRAGIEVTDIRQVKGLEFDYVVLLDVNASTFPADEESRHLFHIAATRAAHQLWIVVTAAPSPLIPPALLLQE